MERMYEVPNGKMRLPSGAMRVLVNTRLLLPGKLEGIGRFTHEVLRRLVTNHPEVEWIFLFDRTPDPSFKYGSNVQLVHCGPQTRHPLLWWAWLQFSVPFMAKKWKATCFLSPDGFASLSLKIPQAVVIHDLNFEHYPQFLPPLVRHYHRYFFPRFAHCADQLITVSEFSRTDLAQTYHLDPAKIAVVPNAGSGEFSPIGETEKIEQRKLHAAGHPYFIFIGAFNPRKNLARLVEAFGRFSRQDPQAHHLVLVGEKMFHSEEFDHAVAALPYPERLVLTGRLNGKDLNNCLAAATALVFPSLFEGFGIPIVEAFACKVPVLTSTTTSMPEVAGDAAILVDPEDVAQISNGMYLLATNAAERNRLIARGLDQLTKFNWDSSAVKMWNAINHLP